MNFSQRSICFNFKKFGSCKFGNRCKYAHITDQNATLHSPQNTFLSELRGLLGSMREVLDIHRQAPVHHALPLAYQQLPQPQFPLAGAQGQLYAPV